MSSLFTRRRPIFFFFFPLSMHCFSSLCSRPACAHGTCKGVAGRRQPAAIPSPFVPPFHRHLFGHPPWRKGRKKEPGPEG